MGSENVTPLFDEFDQHLSQLCAGFGVPCTNERRAAYRVSLNKLHPVAWARLIEHCLGPDGPDRFPTTKQLWGIHKGLRSAVQRAVPKVDENPWAGDDWAMQANMHLLTHIMGRAIIGVYYCSPRDRNHLHRGPGWQGDAETQALTAPLVAYKNAWAQDMREWGSMPAPELQRSTWTECMRRADVEVDQVRVLYTEIAI